MVDDPAEVEAERLISGSRADEELTAATETAAKPILAARPGRVSSG